MIVRTKRSEKWKTRTKVVRAEREKATEGSLLQPQLGEIQQKLRRGEKERRTSLCVLEARRAAEASTQKKANKQKKNIWYEKLNDWQKNNARKGCKKGHCEEGKEKASHGEICMTEIKKLIPKNRKRGWLRSHPSRELSRQERK